MGVGVHKIRRFRRFFSSIDDSSQPSILHEKKKSDAGTFSSPQPFSLLLADRALARETKGYGDKGFPVLDYRASGIYICMQS